MTPSESLTLVKSNVLIADDSLPGLLAVKAMLEAEGVECDTASDGRSALDKAMSGSYGALLLDEHMPGLRGSDVCAQLRQTPGPNQYALIVSLSGEQGQSQREVMDKAGFDAILVKPVSKRALISTLNNTMTATSAAQGEKNTDVGIDSLLPDLVAELVLDISVQKDMLGQFDPATVARLFGLFVDELSVLSVRLNTAIEHSSESEIMAVSHILKNSAELYGAKRLARLARILNETPPSDNTHLMAFAKELLEICHKTRQVVVTELLS